MTHSNFHVVLLYYYYVYHLRAQEFLSFFLFFPFPPFVFAWLVLRNERGHFRNQVWGRSKSEREEALLLSIKTTKHLLSLTEKHTHTYTRNQFNSTSKQASNKTWRRKPTIRSMHWPSHFSENLHRKNDPSRLWNPIAMLLLLLLIIVIIWRFHKPVTTTIPTMTITTTMELLHFPHGTKSLPWRVWDSHSRWVSFAAWAWPRRIRPLSDTSTTEKICQRSIWRRPSCRTWSWTFASHRHWPSTRYWTGSFRRRLDPTIPKWPGFGSSKACFGWRLPWCRVWWHCFTSNRFCWNWDFQRIFVPSPEPMPVGTCFGQYPMDCTSACGFTFRHEACPNRPCTTIFCFSLSMHSWIGSLSLVDPLSGVDWDLSGRLWVCPFPEPCRGFVISCICLSTRNTIWELGPKTDGPSRTTPRNEPPNSWNNRCRTLEHCCFRPLPRRHRPSWWGDWANCPLRPRVLWAPSRFRGPERYRQPPVWYRRFGSDTIWERGMEKPPKKPRGLSCISSPWSMVSWRLSFWFRYCRHLFCKSRPTTTMSLIWWVSNKQTKRSLDCLVY